MEKKRLYIEDITWEEKNKKQRLHRDGYYMGKILYKKMTIQKRDYIEKILYKEGTYKKRRYIQKETEREKKYIR